MGINQYQAPQGSPFDRLAGAVVAGLTLAEKIQGIKANTAAIEKARIESEQLSKVKGESEDLNSPLLSSVNSRAQTVGIKIPEGMNFRQAKEAGLLDAIAKREEAMTKGEQERLTASAKVPKGHKKVVNPDTGKVEVVADHKPLPSDKVLAVNQGNAIPEMLQDVSATIEANQDSFGPVAGRWGSMNPYNEKTTTVDAQMRAASQAFGRYMEGGVLRKEDEEKYRKMFPQLSDTPEVAKNKLALVDRMLKQKQVSDIAALESSGYDVSGLKKDVSIPGVPKALQGKQKGGVIPEAVAGDGADVRIVDGKAYRKVKGGWQAL